MKFSEFFNRNQIKESKLQYEHQIRFDDVGGGLDVFISSAGSNMKGLGVEIGCFSSSGKKEFPVKITDDMMQRKIKEVEKAVYYKDLFRPMDDENTKNIIVKGEAIDLIKDEIEEKLMKDLLVIANKFDKEIATLMKKYN